MSDWKKGDPICFARSGSHRRLNVVLRHGLYGDFRLAEDQRSDERCDCMRKDGHPHDYKCAINFILVDTPSGREEVRATDIMPVVSESRALSSVSA